MMEQDSSWVSEAEASQVLRVDQIKLDILNMCIRGSQIRLLMLIPKHMAKRATYNL